MAEPESETDRLLQDGEALEAVPSTQNSPATASSSFGMPSLGSYVATAEQSIPPNQSRLPPLFDELDENSQHYEQAEKEDMMCNEVMGKTSQRGKTGKMSDENSQYYMKAEEAKVEEEDINVGGKGSYGMECGAGTCIGRSSRRKFVDGSYEGVQKSHGQDDSEKSWKGELKSLLGLVLCSENTEEKDDTCSVKNKTKLTNAIFPAKVGPPNLTPTSTVPSPHSSNNPSEDELLLLYKISEIIPTVSINNTNLASNAKKSRAIIINPKKKYCTGDKLLIQIEMFDSLGNRKTYGGDFITPRMFNPKLQAGASGVVEDFNNGTYHIHFTLFWEGKVYISLLLYHSSEAVSALWRARDNDYGLISFIGTFVNRNQSTQSECGFKVDLVKEICEYKPVKDRESFYCIKPDNFDCGALSSLKSFNREVTFLGNTEKLLFNRENLSINIQADFDINVFTCTAPANLSICTTGMQSPFPSGFVLQNKWRPAFCKIPDFTTQNQMYACLKDRMVYLFGDSTMRQWFNQLAKTLQGFKKYDLASNDRPSAMLAGDDKWNILIYYKKHSHPFVASHSYGVRDDSYMSDEINHVVGGPHHVVAFTLGQHFRPFPIQLFIRRVLNVRRAIEKLLLRSPDTKVIIKTENTREISADVERFSDFHGYIHNMIVKEAFKDLPVATVDAWDMTIAFNSCRVHPLENVIMNEMYMFLSYLCT
ncbi:NXPE family member 1-like [Leptodactylus fuscus]|uniref:NXPE family member 1-like n=1 Tax=Leptodactylus fuscus TaxID=238119 RepID=UPI003F4EF6EF